MGIYIIAFLVSVFSGKWREKLIYKASLLAGVLLLFMIINIITSKTALLPTLYFPSLDRIIGLLYEQRGFLIENVLSSLKLLIVGFCWGASVGFLTGLALGYNKKVGYWLNPVTKVIGAIPTTAWIPLALSVFPTTHVANVFLIAFAAWFPVTLMAVEMNGNSNGIGWYINWQKQIMMYDGVYADLIIIAIICSLILTLLFKVRDYILVWQKGVVKW